MPDRLYFSAWLRDPGEKSVLRQFGKMLERFPYSKLAKRGPVLRVYAIEHSEPPVLEREFTSGSDVVPILNAAGEFMKADCACEIDTAWDLWQYDSEWKLRPASVTLACYGPEFDNEQDDQLRIEFGPDDLFLRSSKIEGALRMGESNLKSLLHLVSEIERDLDLEKRQLWSESGANFADVLKQTLGSYRVQ